jgi:hypothetical protein
MELLYGNIIIRSVENFAALHRTLVAPDSCAGRLVRKMMISCVVPFGDHLMMFEECMKRIIVHCPLIASLAVDLSFRSSSVDTRPWHPPYQNLGLLLRTMHVSDVTLNITHLHWGCCLQLRDLVSMLQHCPKLKRLQFYPHTQDDTLVVLPNLQELHFGYSDCISSSPTFCAESWLGAQWLMPQLQRLTSFADVTLFCRTYGHSLQYLHLGPDWRSWSYTTVQTILDECPLLDHLVLWNLDHPDAIHLLSHPKVMWIDMWVDIPRTLDMLESLVQTDSPGLLSLCRIRALDSRLWGAHATDLPALLPPETAALEDGFEYTYIGLNIQQRGHLVFQTDLTVTFIVGEGSSSDDEFERNDFDESSSDDTSDSEQCSEDENSSSSCREDNPFDLLEELGEWAPDHASAVAVFSAILES